MWADQKTPWAPPEYDDDVILAVRAVAEGVASDRQQKLFWRYLMYMTKANEEFQSLSFRPNSEGGESAMVFAEGRRFVGMMLRKFFRPELTPRSAESSGENRPGGARQSRLKKLSKKA